MSVYHAALPPNRAPQGVFVLHAITPAIHRGTSAQPRRLEEMDTVRYDIHQAANHHLSSG